VILINLLPHREEKRQRRKTAFFAGLGLAALVGVAVAGLWYLVLQQLMASQVERNAFLGSEISKLELQIKDIANLKSEIESLKARQRAVEDLQIDRNVPVHVLNELVKQVPEGVYLSSVKQDGQTLTLVGVAQTNERVSEFLRNTAYNSQWLEKPDLVEIKVATNPVAPGARDQKRLFNFSVRVMVKRPQDLSGAAEAAASGIPVRAASAPKV
jgi:type IV pilus assembly protein PilN